MSIYLDYNASAPINNKVLETMVNVYKNNIGNADSRTHEYGDSARKIVEQSRQQVASLLGINKDEVFFTSGATESNNIAVQGLKEYGLKKNKKHVIISAIEHKAVLLAAQSLEKYGFEVQLIQPQKNGMVDAADIINSLRKDTLLVSIMHANNETGIIQPVKEIGEYLNDKDVFFHIDATQTCGKLVEEVKELKYDMMSISAHKLQGPQGIGALILKKKNYRLPPISPLFFGGQQEHGIRPGTIPVALTAGFGKACEIAEYEYKNNIEHCKKIKTILLEQLNNSKLNFMINGDISCCMPNSINISLIGISSEALMLSSKQYCGISNGSACNSNNYSPSHVLVSMKLTDEELKSAIRISWGHDTDIDEFKNKFQLLLDTAKSLIF